MTCNKVKSHKEMDSGSNELPKDNNQYKVGKKVHKVTKNMPHSKHNLQVNTLQRKKCKFYRNDTWQNVIHSRKQMLGPPHLLSKRKPNIKVSHQMNCQLCRSILIIPNNLCFKLTMILIIPQVCL